MIIEIPEDLAEHIRAAAEAEGADVSNYALAKLEQIFAPDEEDADESDEDLIAALRQGIADRDAGNLRTFEQVDGAVETALAARRARLAKVA